MPLDVELEWNLIEDHRDPRWGFSRVLYGICHPDTDRVLYVGKADGQTVRQRFKCRSKAGVCDHIVHRFNTDKVKLRVGEFITDARLTPELLGDVESLLIKRLQPCCNIQSLKTRVERPGLRVSCTGNWPERRGRFIDRDRV